MLKKTRSNVDYPSVRRKFTTDILVYSENYYSDTDDMTLKNIKSETNIGDNPFSFESFSYSDLFTRKSIKALTYKHLYLWIVTGFSYYGIFLNLENLSNSSKDIYYNAVTSYLAELSADILSGYLTLLYNKKSLLNVYYSLSCLGPIICIVSLSYQYVWINNFGIFLATFSISSALNLLFVFSGEYFPPQIITLAMNTLILSTDLSSYFVPLILIFMRNINVIITVSSFIAIIIIQTLPETNHDNLEFEFGEIDKDQVDSRNLSSLFYKSL